MPQEKISKAELERQLDSHADPVRKLPAGFASTHRRIPKTVSTFVVDVIERIDQSSDSTPPATPAPAAQEEIESRFLELSRRR